MSTPQRGAEQELSKGMKDNWVRINGVLRAVEAHDSPFVTLCKFLRENFFWGSSLVVGFSFFFGAVNLFGFAKFVGRPDLFMGSFEYGHGLVSLTLPFFLIYVVIFFLYFISSYIFVSELKELRTDKVCLRSLNFWLFTLVAVCATLGSSIIMVVGYGWHSCSIFILFIIFVVVLCWFVDWYKSKDSKRKISFFRLFFSVIGVVFVNVFFLWLCLAGLIPGLLNGRNS